MEDTHACWAVEVSGLGLAAELDSLAVQLRSDLIEYSVETMAYFLLRTVAFAAAAAVVLAALLEL